MTTWPILNARHYGWLTTAFALFVVYGSLVPLQYVPCSLSDALERYSTAMAKPLSFASRSDWAANVLLFIPLGFVGLGMLTVDRGRQIRSLALIPALAIFSAAVEFMQVWFPARTTSVNDVVAETLGGMIGMGAWGLFGQLLTERIRAAWSSLEPGDWAAKLLPAYLAVLVFAHGMPFDLTISPGEIWHKYQRGMEPDAESDAPAIALMPKRANLPEKMLLQVVYFLPLGILLARLPNPRWRDDQALPRVACAGLLVAVAIELLQLIVASAGCYALDVVLGTFLVVTGWKLATWRRPLNANVWLAAGIAWCVALLAVRWSPMQTPTEAQTFNMIPFADYYAGNYLTAFNRIFHVLVLFVPVGFLLPWPKQPRWLIAAGAGTLLGLVIEIGQQQWTTHTATISDVMLALLGTTFGAQIQTRVPESAPPPKQTAKPSAYPKIVFYTGMPSSAKQR